MAVWFEIYNIIGYLVFICVFLVQMHVIVIIIAHVHIMVMALPMYMNSPIDRKLGVSDGIFIHSHSVSLN